jgi:hypothetical protein
MEKKVLMSEKQLQQQLSGQAAEPSGSSSAPAASPVLRKIPAAASLVQLVHIVMPPHANHMNT